MRWNRSVVCLAALALAALAFAEELPPAPVKKPSASATSRSVKPAQTVQKPAVLPVASRVAAEECTSAQEETIERARRAAAVRAQVAVDRIRGVHPSTGESDRRETAALSETLIEGNLDFGQVQEISEAIRNRVSSASLQVVCEPPSQSECTVRTAYVVPGSPVIHFCPHFFETSTEEQRIRTLLHESGHLVNIREPGDSETYCPIFDCASSCGGAPRDDCSENCGFLVADAWSHFMHCASNQPPDPLDAP